MESEEQERHSEDATAEANKGVVENSSAKQWAILLSLFSILWWRNAITVAITFAPNCVVPAVFAMLSGTIVYVAMSVSMGRLQAFKDLSDLILAMGTLSLGGLLGIAFLALSFGAWLSRLSAYAYALVGDSSLQDLAALPKGERKAVFNQAMKDVEPKKIHVGAVLLWATLYMMPSFLVFLLSVLGKLITLPQFMGAMAIQMPWYWSALCYVAAIPNFLFLMSFSIVALIIAASLSLKPQKSANLAFSLSLKLFLPLNVLTVVFSAIGIIIGAPSDLMQMFTLDSVTSNRDITLRVVAHVWQSAVNIVLLPLSLTPFCDMLRAQLRNYSLAGSTQGDGIS